MISATREKLRVVLAEHVGSTDLRVMAKALDPLADDGPEDDPKGVAASLASSERKLTPASSPSPSNGASS